MSSKKSPVVPLKDLSERAMGFFLTFWKRIEKRGSLLSQRSLRRSAAVETVGIDLGQAHLLILSLEKAAGKPTITHFRFEPRPASPEAMAERLRLIFSEEHFAAKKVRVAIKSQAIVIRVLTLPQMKKSDLASALQYEVEKYIPFKPSEVIMDFQILAENIPRGSGKAMEILLVAVKQPEIHELLKLFQGAGLQVEVIDVSAFAFANLLQFIAPDSKEQTIGFLDMGAEISTFGILLHGKPVFIRDISFGGVDILKLLKRKLGLEPEAALAVQRNLPTMTPEYRGVVEQALATFLTEIKLSMGYYSDHVTGALPLQKLYISGGGFRFIPEDDFLERAIKIPVLRPEIFSRFDIHSTVDQALLKKNEDILPAALGLCLR